MSLRDKALPKVKSSTTKIGKDTREKVENTYTAELIIGICAPIGSYSSPVIDELERQLTHDYGYSVIRIKISDIISNFHDITATPIQGETPAHSVLQKKINGGNQLRKDNNNFSILAELAIAQIHFKRSEETSSKNALPDISDYRSQRVCYIIDSLKNQEELLLLRSVYRGLFYLFSVFSPLSLREKTLINKGLSASEVQEIITIDDFENNEHGQNVRDTFTDADFFIRVDEHFKSSLPNKVNRYLNLIFDCEVVTPLPHEIAMYQAKSAANNSGCLSRQVGAAITDQNFTVLSTGWNDVPQFGGNLYTDNNPDHDHRCKVAGFCSNDIKKKQLSEEIVAGFLSDPQVIGLVKEGTDHTEIKNILGPQLEVLIRKSTKVKDLIEYSRSVHAEMHSIIIGSQKTGSKMVDGNLFCTTYPCHNCARHIILAGIKQVYYIEPYKKSLSLTLHNDAITENEEDKNKLRILLYDGVGPRRFMKLFSSTKPRKGLDGKTIVFDRKIVEPKTRLSLQSIPILERQAIHSITEAGLIDIKLKSIGYEPKNQIN